MPALLQRSFAAHLAPGDRGALILSARIEFVIYGSDGSAGGPDPTMATDSIEGAGVVIGPGGRAIASYPLRARVPLKQHGDHIGHDRDLWQRMAVSRVGLNVGRETARSM
jgi:hypothetical protein